MIRNKQQWHLLQIGITTNILEWYEFIVYAYLATVIGHVFFPNTSNIMALMQAFFVFCIGYLARPIGSLFFGYIGDKQHAGVALRYSLIAMTIPTFLIGLLPTYQEIGYSATLLLVLLRIIQGIATGGELPMSASYLYQASPHKKQQIFFCSLPYFGSGVGILLASLAVYVLYLCFSHNAILNGAWRIPFLLGLPLSAIILYVRRNLGKNAVSKQQTLSPIFHSKYLNGFIKSLVVVSFVEVNMYVLFVWLPSYLQYFLNLPHLVATVTNLCGLIVLTVVILFFSYIGQYTNYRHSYLAAVVLIIATVYPLFILLGHITSFVALLSIQLLFALLVGCIIGNTLIIVCNAFPATIRNRAMAISITFPPAIIGGTTPLLCSYFIHVFHINNFPALYIMFFGILTLIVNNYPNCPDS